MRLFVFLSFFLSLPNSLDAALVKAGRYNPETESMELDLASVKCKEQKFALTISGCKNISPERCFAKVIPQETKETLCVSSKSEQDFSLTISFPLKENGLATARLRGATLSVSGPVGDGVFVTLPY